MIRHGLILVVCCGAVLRGATITGDKDGGSPVRHDPYTVSLTPRPVQHIGTGDDKVASIFDSDLKLLKGAFGTFDSSKGGSDAPGTFNILQYQPFALNYGGGANFTVLYDDGIQKPTADYDWIQIAHFHNWGSHGSGDKVDGQPGTAFPFYYPPSKLPTQKISNYASKANSGSIWDDQKNYPDQKIQNPLGEGKVPAGDLLFNDQPYCAYTCADADGKAWAYFDLFLVKFTWNGGYDKKAGGTAKLLDGIRWGVEITKDPQTAGNPGSLPEPATYLLTGIGLIAACGMRYSRLKGAMHR